MHYDMFYVFKLLIYLKFGRMFIHRSLFENILVNNDLNDYMEPHDENIYLDANDSSKLPDDNNTDYFAYYNDYQYTQNCLSPNLVDSYHNIDSIPQSVIFQPKIDHGFDPYKIPNCQYFDQIIKSLEFPIKDLQNEDFSLETEIQSANETNLTDQQFSEFSNSHISIINDKNLQKPDQHNISLDQIQSNSNFETPIYNDQAILNHSKQCSTMIDTSDSNVSAFRNMLNKEMEETSFHSANQQIRNEKLQQDENNRTYNTESAISNDLDNSRINLNLDEILVIRQFDNSFSLNHSLEYQNFTESSIINETWNFDNSIDDEEEINNLINFVSFKFAYAKDLNNILRFLIQNSRFSIKFDSLILENNFDLENNDFFKILNMRINLEIMSSIEQISRSEDLNLYHKNLLTLKGSCASNFCIVCEMNRCSMFSSSFKRSNKSFDFLRKNLQKKLTNDLEIELCKFLNMIHSTNNDIKSINLNFFLTLFTEQRKSLFKLINMMQSKKICINRKSKLSVIKEIFHNFKCHHPKIKIHFIPEFLPLFFLLLNRDIKIYYRKNNILFVIFLFYFQAFENVFEILAQYNFLEEKTTEIERAAQKLKINLISLLLRINFVEPLAMLFTRSEKILKRYRFHSLSLFQYQCFLIQNKTFNKKKLKFLENSIFWIFNCVEHLTAEHFLEIYENADFDFYKQTNQPFFMELMTVLLKFVKYESYLRQNHFQHEIRNKSFENFLTFSKKNYIVKRNLQSKSNH